MALHGRRRHGSNNSDRDSGQNKLVSFDDKSNQDGTQQPENSMTSPLLPNDPNGMPSIFSLKKPRDVFAGTSSGLKSCTKGVFGGIGSLVVCPYMMAKDLGVKGFFLGAGLGVLTCVVSTISGVTVGLMQIIRGTLNTPSAIVHKARGKKWDKKTRKWEKEYYNLQEEAQILKEPLEDPPKINAKASSSVVVDCAFYDLLEVNVDATSAEIRKAYYKKSLKYHPDKNDSPEAAAKFREVSEAYQVLSDEKRRDVYNRQGKEAATSQLPKLDPSIFFSTMFGSFLFEPYIGTLMLSSICEGGPEAIQREQFGGRRQLLREVELAVKLAERLDNGIAAGSNEFTQQMQEEAKRLVRSTNGKQMLATIGWVYRNEAKQMSDANIAMKGIWKVQQKGNSIKTKGEAVASFGKSLILLNSIQNKMKKAEKGDSKSSSSSPKEVEVGCMVRVSGLESHTELNDTVGYVSEVKSNGRAVVAFSADDAPKSIKIACLEVIDTGNDAAKVERELLEKVPMLMDTLWSVSVIDIQSTLKKVCYRALKDMSVSTKMRKKRVSALLSLGQIFSETAKNADVNKTMDDKKRDFEFALKMMLEGATGDDVEVARQNIEMEPSTYFAPAPRTKKSKHTA